MKINSPNSQKNRESTHFHQKTMGKMSKLFFMFLGIGLFSFIVGLYIPTANEVRNRVKSWAENHGHNAIRKDIRLRQALIKLPLSVYESFSPLDESLPELHIDIKFKHIKKLYQKRVNALSKGVLVQGADDFVPASIRYDNRSTKVKLRLKGDWTDHLEGKKWSFRIHVKGKDQLFGMRRFSIQHPKVRGYHYEPIFFETLRHVGVLSPRYFFINVIINGDNLGIMALEEHFSKELLESNNRREGVIIRYDESLLWDARVLTINDTNEAIFHNYKNAAIDSFRSSRILKSPVLSENLSVAVGLLRSFTNGDLSPSQVFDVELMGRFLAVLEFWGSHHAMYWHNLRFYLNPLTLKLEPIGFDSDLQNREKPGEIISQLEPMTAAILDDPKIFNIFYETLINLSAEVLDGSLIEKLKKVNDEHLIELRKEYYFLEAFPFEELKMRADFLLSADSNVFQKKPVVFPVYPKLLHAFLIEDKEETYLEVSSIVPHDINISSIKWLNKKDHTFIRDFQPASIIKVPLTLSATPPGELPNTHTIAFQSNESINQSFLEIIASIEGDDKQYRHIAINYFSPLKIHPIPNSTLDEQLSMHSFLTIDKSEKKIFVKQGQWEVNNSIVVPANYDLIVSKGTTLIFPQGEGIFSSSALIFEGTADRPIILRGSPSHDGTPGTWQGIFVQNAEHPSEWSHVKVSDTISIQRSGWNLTGGVTFYKSEVHLKNCVFENNHAEDALNIVNSNFHIINSDFFSTISDAFDADFSVGEVEGGLFRDIGKAGGGDAIDISGSTVSVSGTHFEKVTDKALSVGERSTMFAKSIQVDNAGTAAASKDGSFLEIENSFIHEVINAGLMTYVKKPEYGHSRIVATNIEYSGSAPFARAEKGSAIVIDGKEIEQEAMDVKELYNTIMKPGARK